jgi:hypothetical protein
MNFFLTCVRGWISDSHRITVSLFTPKIIPTCLLLTDFNEQYLFFHCIKSREYIPTSVLFFRELLYLLCGFHREHGFHREQLQRRCRGQVHEPKA